MPDRVLIAGVRVVPAVAGAGVPSGRVDVLITDGRVEAVGPGLPREGAEVHDGGGAWVVPGLWDQHVHMSQWAATSRRLDVSGTVGPEEVLARVAAHLTGEGGPADAGAAATLVEGFGWRLGAWSSLPSTAALDAVVGDRPVVLVSGDCHGGWLSSAAYRALGVPVRPGHVEEDEWFALWARLGEIPQDERAVADALASAVSAASAKGVVGIVDLELADLRRGWPARVAAGVDGLRARVSVYRDRLEAALADGVRSGDVLDERGLVTMGPFKIITDGSLGTRTAWCCEPYATGGDAPSSSGISNVPLDELTDLMRRAHGGGLGVAAHAIGDRALADVLSAFEASGAAGCVEHAQLARMEDLPRMARLGVAASVQPAHLLDDRDTTALVWPDRMERCFPLASMLAAGVELRLGSDAPVAPLDPWLAMAAAVHRSADDRGPWAPEQAISPADALRASTDGRLVEAGAPGDLVLLAEDPFAPVDLGDAGATAAAGARLREVRPLATVLGGRLTHSR